jgi:hypothetical protein
VQHPRLLVFATADHTRAIRAECDSPDDVGGPGPFDRLDHLPRDYIEDHEGPIPEAAEQATAIRIKRDVVGNIVSLERRDFLARETVGIFDAVTGSQLPTPKGHAKVVCSLAFSSDGGQLASSSDDRTVKVCNVVTGREILTFSRNYSG